MPNSAELQELRQEVAALAVNIAALGPKLDNAVTHREVQAIKDFTERQRKRTTWTAVISVLIAMIATIGVNNAMLTKCFLRGGGTLHESTACNVFFPGYNGVIKLQRKQVGQFQKLTSTIPKNAKDNARQDREIRDLKRRLHNLGG